MPRKNQIHSLHYLKENRKALRIDLTSAEATLWRILKGEKLNGVQFRKQHSIENFIVDFYCPSAKLIIELDGQGHFTSEGKSYDSIRDARLQELGFIILRFENKELFKNPEGVIHIITQHLSFKL